MDGVESDQSRRRKRWPVFVGALVDAVAVVLLLGFTVGLPFLDLRGPFAGQATEVRQAIQAGLLILIVAVALRVVGRIFERATAPVFGSHAQARSIWKLVGYIVWAGVLLVLAFSVFGPNLSAAAVGAGIIGGALVITLQRPLLNAVAWMVITANRMYRIGDRVAFGDTRGYVTDIRLTHTLLREFGAWMKGDTFTGRIASVPNSLIFDTSVSNYTRDVPFIWDEVENLVTYESDVDKAKQYMLEAAKDVVGNFMASRYYLYLRRLEIRDLEEFLLKRPEVRLEFAESGVQMQVVFFCPVEARRRVKSEITERIWRRFNEDPDVAIAYPHVQFVPHRERVRVSEELARLQNPAEPSDDLEK